MFRNLKMLGISKIVISRSLIILFVLSLSVVIGCARKIDRRANVIDPVQPPPVVETPTRPTPDPVDPLQQPPVPPQVEDRPGDRPPVTRDIPELQRVHFAFDSYDLLPEARRILTQNAQWLRANPVVRIRVEGHCDERGTVEYNLALGARRANAVRDYLISLGIPGQRIESISFGEERPLDARSNEEAWTKNRRADSVKITP